MEALMRAFPRRFVALEAEPHPLKVANRIAMGHRRGQNKLIIGVEALDKVEVYIFAVELAVLDEPWRFPGVAPATFVVSVM